MSKEIQLEEGGVYFDKFKDLVKIVYIKEEKNDIKIYNITYGFNQHRYLDKTREDQIMVKRIR